MNKINVYLFTLTTKYLFINFVIISLFKNYGFVGILLHDKNA